MVKSSALVMCAALVSCRAPTAGSTGDADASTPASLASALAPELERTAAAAPPPSSERTLPPLEAPRDAGVPAAPFGAPVPIPRYGCGAVQKGGQFKSFLAAGDTRLAFVDGDDALALVNRSPTGALPSTYTPTDLVDLRDGHPKSAAQCESGECLRKDAAAALKGMLAEMQQAKVPGYVVSSFRGFGTQCWVFANWATTAKGGFCEATEQSALPGHSQHQLGTTVDLFTSEWAARGAVFRNGFGCTEGGKWLDANAWRFGFVLPYPIHPDDRKDGSRCEARRDRAIPIDPKTGYKNEPWHLRFLGLDAAARYHQAWLASGPGTPDEITLEQWLRAERGLPGDGELPVCDGCQCGACATLAEDDTGTPCGKESLHLDGQGRVDAPADPPHLLDAKAIAKDGLIRVEATVRAPAHTPTQPPVTDDAGPAYGAGATYQAFAPFPDAPPRRYADLPGAWRVAVEPVPPGQVPRWPWRASLANPRGTIAWNRANLVLPAKSGEHVVPIAVTPPPGTRALRVTLLRDGKDYDTREVPLP
jgi:D-alanyl-D-alanine carboxypeptidase